MTDTDMMLEIPDESHSSSEPHPNIVPAVVHQPDVIALLTIISIS